MDIITSPGQMQAAALAWQRAGRPISLVPTMGFLHAGHLSLVTLARKAIAKPPSPSGSSRQPVHHSSESDGGNGFAEGEALTKEDRPIVVLSIFVNPTQFGPHEDFDKYPRNFENDRRLCEQNSVDILFGPSAESMYCHGHTVFVDETTMSHGLCGASRPGHFRGVLTVVAKLFHLILPDVAVFGQKDAQQARLIRQMVRDLNLPIRIIFGPIIREPDGLAMSSRNTYLLPTERHDALCMVQSLQLARNLYQQGERHAQSIVAAMTRLISQVSSANIDYIHVVDEATLQPVNVMDGNVLIALAVRIGKTRLIDNLILPDDRLSQVPS